MLVVLVSILIALACIADPALAELKVNIPLWVDPSSPIHLPLLVVSSYKIVAAAEGLLLLPLDISIPAVPKVIPVLAVSPLLRMIMLS